MNDEDEPDGEPWWTMLSPRRSLPARLALAAGAMAVAFALFVSVFAGKLLRPQLVAQVGASFEERAYQIGDKLDRSFYERFREIVNTVTLPTLRVATIPVAERRRLLEAMLDSSAEYAWIGFANPTGLVTFATKGQLEGTNLSGEKWFRDAREKPYVGDVHEVPNLTRAIAGAESAPMRFLDVTMPVVNDSGQYLGVLVARLAWANARNIQISVVPDTAERERIGVTIYSSTKDALLDSGGSGWNMPPESPTPPDTKKSRGFFIETIPGDADYLTGYARTRGFREFRSLGWVIAVRQPMTRVYAPVRELQVRILWSGLGLTIVAVVLGWFFGLHLIQSFSAISAAAKRIGAGDVLTLIPRPQAKDEIQAMCTELGTMVDKLRQQQETLETENNQLKSRLQSGNPQ